MDNPTPATTPADMTLARRLFGGYLTPEKLPVSFNYGGKNYTGIPNGTVFSKEFTDATMLRSVFKGHIGDSLKIKAELIEYRDYPVVEYTVYFKGVGDTNTEMLKDAKSIDIEFTDGNPVLIHNNGDEYACQGYIPGKLQMDDGIKFEQKADGGRPSSGAFPYQRLLYDDYGINISIGWPGQWSCEHTGTENGVRFTAGQETVNTYIKPGETFRTARMTLMAFNGDENRGINMWRRWFNAHVTPRSKGDIIQPKLTMSDNNGGIEFLEATEENQLKTINYIKDNDIGANLWWIDAGWYPCPNEEGYNSWPFTGDWRPDPNRFPNGLGPVGKACKDAGMEFLLWFEPERTKRNTRLYNEHPEWMLFSAAGNAGNPKEANKDVMVDITNPDCLRWMCETVSGLIKDSGVDCYRQDFNYGPLHFWREFEVDDRKGMRENLYIQAYLKFWDYLLTENPDLWIDSCASGGRRNDMESMRRSVPLHPTDFAYGYHHINQSFRHTLHAWFPYTRAWNGAWDKNGEYMSHDDYYGADDNDGLVFDEFSQINGFGSLTVFYHCGEWKSLNGDMTYHDKILKVWKKFSQIQLRGDFYALTENHRDNTKWTAFQFDSPERGEGAFQVLRNNRAKDGTLTVYPHGFDQNFDYIFINKLSGEKYFRSGKEVAESGVTFEQPIRSGTIWFYKRKRWISK